MLSRPLLMLSVLFAVSVASAQTVPASHPASAPAPKPIAAPTTQVPGSPAQPNPAAAPVQPQSDAGATERGLAPVRPASAGVTQGVRDANARDADPQGHTLDPHGKPVGQAPAPSTTVH